tara:strand:+ start:3396 stop:4022 length:627 start_codon:yes stop_codon:yes gene_type:complete
LEKNIIILSLSINETKIISSKLKEVSLVSINLWDDLVKSPIITSNFDALIITGSEDFLKENNSDLKIPTNLLTTTKSALMNDMPILGINLGMHVINLALGGKYPKFTPPVVPNESNQKRKDIFISPGSKLTTIIGYAGLMRIGQPNSYGISITEKSDILRASCYSVENGIIEAFESDEHNWVLGTRFDPFGPHIPPNFEHIIESFLNT